MSNGTSVRTEHLDALAALLESAGLTTSRHYQATPVRLVVENGDLAAGGESVMSECITVKAQEAATVFCWRAGDPIGPVDDLQAAATKIVALLTLQELADDSTVPSS